MRILLWHVHGSWTTSFVQGRHQYFLPVVPGRGPDGRGRAESWDWPAGAVEVTRDEVADLDVDVVVLQRPEELHRLAESWLRRRPGRDVPAVYVEHNTPRGDVGGMEHHAKDRPDLTVVHVTNFNELFWDTGRTPSRVIEHGVIDPGYRYSGELPRAAVIVNEPARRGRIVGTDLLGQLGSAMPLDVFGMATEPLGGRGDIPQHRLHGEVAMRRAYLHPYRWTSLGLALIEAMHLGLPIVALATTEVPDAVPQEAGTVSTSVERLRAALVRMRHDPDEATVRGKIARETALERFGLARFLADWDVVLDEQLAR